MNEETKVSLLIDLFDAVFESYNTRLIKGESEPLYSPSDAHHSYHRVIFAHGFFSSALHEIAHWCIAGKNRRQQVDYGYWYEADGRDQSQQAAFEQVEIKPQALEWAFSIASGHHFRASTDNLNGAPPDTATFTVNIKGQLMRYIEDGFPPRAELFLSALHKTFNTPPLHSKDSLEHV